MFGSKSKFIKVSVVYLLIIQLAGCASRYQYTTLAPVESKERTAGKEYETINAGSTEFKLYKWDIKSFTKDLEKNAKLDRNEKRELKKLKNEKYPVFLLVIEKKKEDVVTIDPSGIKAEFLSRYEEDTESNLTEIKESLSQNIITSENVTLKDEEKTALYIILPYSVEEEHMLRMDISGIKINDEPVELKYSFHASDTWEKRKRILQYAGLGLGVIGVVVGVIIFLK